MPRTKKHREPRRFEARIESLAFGGKGVARIDGKVAFVPRAFPGEEVVVEVVGRRKKFDRSRLISVEVASPDRRPAVCSHVAVCGGCATQELDYPRQLEAKAQQVRDCLQRIGDLQVPEWAPPIGSPREFRYRNKMDFTFAHRAWIEAGPPEGELPSPALGLHVPGRFDGVFDLEVCHLCSQRVVETVRHVRAFARHHQLPAYFSRNDTGLLRHLITREGHHTGELLVGLVVREPDDVLAEFGSYLAERIDGLTGVVLVVNRTKATIARGDEEIVLHGRDHIHERLGGRLFRVAAQSFFQTNTEGAETLVQAIRERPEAQGKHLLDLYCGAGTLGLCLADRFERITGIEQNEAAVADARENARLNGIDHTSFESGDVLDWLRTRGTGRGSNLATESDSVMGSQAGGAEATDGLPVETFDTVIVDPPRAGLHPKALRLLPHLGAKHLIYVSCNPSTLARDASELAGHGFVPKALRIVDMFPQTGHVESVLVFDAPQHPS